MSAVNTWAAILDQIRFEVDDSQRCQSDSRSSRLMTNIDQMDLALMAEANCL